MGKSHFWVRIWYIALAIVISFSSNLFSQDNPYDEISIASPNAASLGKYGDIPVNNHTGIPSIDIPIYTVNEGPISLPISLSYHASGIRVDEVASWVGLGWTLNAGGVITRTANGYPDEKGTTANVPHQKGYFSDYGYNSYIWDDTISYSHSYTPSYGLPNSTWLNDPSEKQYDGEPDMFSFNFNGVSGKFYFRPDRTPVIVPAQDLKIEWEYNETSNRSIQSFKITTPDGTKYYFGVDSSTVDPVEITNPFSGSTGYSYGFTISSWYLNKIESHDGKFWIKLEYASENYGQYVLSSKEINQSEGDEYSVVKNLIQGVRLSSIYTPTDSIDFIATTVREDLSDYFHSMNESSNTTARRLDTIRIADFSGNCKSLVFDYEYFQDNTTVLPGNVANYIPNHILNSDKKRLKLNSIREWDCSYSLSKPATTFTYFSGLVPRRFSFGKDHWGFYNGVTNNSQLIPTYSYRNHLSEIVEVSGADREPDWPAMRNGSLQKITYPTGGYSEFEFEANDTYVSSSEIQNQSRGGGSNYGTNYLNPNTPVYSSSHVFDDTKIYSIDFLNSADIETGSLKVNGQDFVLSAGNSTTIYVNSTTPPADITLDGTITIEIYEDSEFESNESLSYSIYEHVIVDTSGDEVVGGLRIKSVTHNDNISTTPNTVINYEYDDPSSGNSSGILFGRPTYIQVIRNDEVAEIGYAWVNGSVSTNQKTWNGCFSPTAATFRISPNTIRPMETTQGNHIGYLNVKVSQNQNGYSVYEFFGSDIFNDTIDDISIRKITAYPSCADPEIPNYPSAPVQTEYKRGLLKKESVYDSANLLLNEKLYDYIYSVDQIEVPGIILSDNTSGGMISTEYRLKSAKKTYEEIVLREYDGSGDTLIQKTETYYSSPFHNQISKTRTTDSKDQLIENQYTYVADLQYTSCDIGSSTCENDLVYDLSQASYQYYVVDKPGCGGDDDCIYHVYKWFKQREAEAYNDYVNCRGQVDTDSCLTVAQATAFAELDAILEMQKQGRNPVLEIRSYYDSLLTNASYNEYKLTSTYVYPEKSHQVSVLEPLSSFNTLSINTNSVIKDSNYLEEVNVKYEDGQIVEVTGRNGVVTSYIWGHSGTVPIVVGRGVDYQTLKANYTTYGYNLRTSSALQGSQITTYKYHPLFGITSLTDANGLETTYEYDSLGRLILIRDNDGNVLQKFEYAYNQTY